MNVKFTYYIMIDNYCLKWFPSSLIIIYVFDSSRIFRVCSSRYVQVFQYGTSQSFMLKATRLNGLCVFTLVCLCVFNHNCARLPSRVHMQEAFRIFASSRDLFLFSKAGHLANKSSAARLTTHTHTHTFILNVR